MDLPRSAGEYVLQRELGRGGMGVVYEAQDAHGRRVAVKVLSPELLDEPGARERFEREARLAASISDPHCVFVYGTLEVDGAPAIAMELMSGDTLELRVGATPRVPVEQAVAWTMELLAGLDAAAKAGVIHRDVKPANCFLAADGHLKVGDFGLSRPERSDLRLTQSGAFLGTPLYASPEQLKGAKLDARSDQYSAAATLFALLAGRPPFTGQSLGELMSGVLTQEPPSVCALRRDVPRALDGVLRRALAKEPAARYASHAELRDALAPFAPGGLRPAPISSRLAAYLMDMFLVGVTTLAVAHGLEWTGLVTSLVDPEAPYEYVAGLPAFLAAEVPPLLYFVLCEGLAGATLAKRLLGLRVLPADSARPSLSRAAVRYLILAACWTPYYLIDDSGATGPAVLCLALGALLFVTARQRNGLRAAHELASGTRTVRIARDEAGFGANAPLDPPRPLAEGAPARVGPLEVVGSVASAPGGRLLRAQDRTLSRSVWVRTFDDPGAAPPPRPEPGARRIRLLQSVRGPDAAYDVYEDPHGASLAEYAQADQRMGWPQVSHVLAGLIEEIGAAQEPLRPGQLWLDRTSTLRVLDFPLGDPGPATPDELLRDAARALLLGRSPRGRGLPHGIPGSAVEPVRRVLHADPGSWTYSEVAPAIADAAQRPWKVTRGHRMAQMAAGSIAVLLVLAVVVLADRVEEAQSSGPSEETPTYLQMLPLAAVAALIAFALRGGVGLWCAGLEVRRHDGTRAPRWLCAVRALLPLVPMVALFYWFEAIDPYLVPAVLVPIAAVIGLAFWWTDPRRKLNAGRLVATALLTIFWTYRFGVAAGERIRVLLKDPKAQAQMDERLYLGVWGVVAALWLVTVVFWLVRPDRSIQDAFLGTRLARR